MNGNKLTLKIDDTKIPAKEFKENIDAFLSLINNVAENICVGKKCIEQYISIQSGSAILVSDIMPKTDKDYEYPQKIKEAVYKGFELLEKNEGEIPPYFNNKTLNLARKLAKHKNIKIIAEQKPEISLTNNTIVSIDSLLRAKHVDLGSIEGMVKTISIAKGFKAVIYELLNNNAVDCILDDEEVQKELTLSLGKRVSAYGEISYNREGIPKKINIKEIRILREGNLATWEDVRGILDD